MNPVTIFTELMKDIMDKLGREITIGCIARIESHNTEKMTADITPLLLISDTTKSTAATYAVLPDVPVSFIHAGGFIIRPKYIKGNLVWVSFATHSIEKGLSGSPDRTDGRTFSIENACVINGIAKKGFTPPSDFSGDGLIICNESGDTRFVMTDGKVTIKTTTVEITADVIVKGKISQTGDFDTTGDVKIEKDVTWLSKTTPTKGSTHIHGTGIGPSSPAKPGS